jgi:hypothetical protein
MHHDGLFNRRDLLRVGSLSIAGSTWPLSIADAGQTGVRGQANVRDFPEIFMTHRTTELSPRKVAFRGRVDMVEVAWQTGDGTRVTYSRQR